jgi:hypothetical protein
MNETSPTGHTSPQEILAQWEGPAVHEPGALFEDRQAEHLSAGSDVAELVSWLAVTAFSGVLGDAAYAGLRAKVLAVLTAWRRRFGQVKIDEIKRQLLVQMQQFRNNGKITDEELRERIEHLFDEVRGESSSGKNSSTP